MKQLTVSIICTVYNKEPWLSRVVDSLIAQETKFEYEIILIDDASTDGSREIVKTYQKRYPDKIRVILNDRNQGISKTWIDACKQAKGKYIARCDGDDFWLDPCKLQKQVTLLENHPEARWSNTDFDIYDENGKFISASGFVSGSIPLSDTYANMLATRGFTMASTWLVEKNLMLEVNEQLDLTTADDTFNLQLDLFQRTPLLFLPEATVAYTINQGSDSRPIQFSKIENRFQKLLATQKAYLDKYPQSQYREILDILLERNNTYELFLTQKERGLAQIGIQKVTIYFDIDERGFNQETIQEYPLMWEDSIQVTIPENCRRIRVDLSEQSSFYQSVSLQSVKDGTVLLPAYTNGISLGQLMLFPKDDPQIIYELPTFWGSEFILHYRLCELDNLQSTDYIAKVLSKELALLQEKVGEGEQLYMQIQSQKDIISQQQEEIERLADLYHSVISSRRWSIPTRIINFFRRKK